jgi:autotransporter-associated beta strand protein
MVFGALAGLMSVSSLQAATVNWNVASGDFNIGTNWDTGAIPGVGDVVNIQNDGTATLSGTFPNKVGYLRVGSATNTGSLVLDTNAVLNVANSSYTMIGSSTGLSSLTVKDNARLNFTGGWTMLSANGPADRAIMTVQDHAVVDVAGFQVGTVGAGAAALYQTGGTIQSSVGAGSHYFGVNTANNYGYYGISGGTFIDNVNNEFAFGYYGTGILNQSGNSSVTFGRSIRLGGGGESYGEYNMSGGVADYSEVGWNSHIGIGGTGVLNLSGGSINFHADTYLGYYAGNGTINIGIAGSPGGTLATKSLIKSSGSGVINFHGGTLQTILGAGNADLLKATTNYVYSEGAVVNTNGNNATITSPLLAPTGNGMASIALSSNGAGYLGAPAVRISGGGGSGATAVADFDAATGTVTGIRVTNPGTGYNDLSSLVVNLVGGGAVTPAVIDTTSFAFNAGNVSGGLTKTGLGTLTLTANSTYTGPTTIQQGTLALSGITLASSGIEVKNGGTLSGTSYYLSPTYYPATTVAAGGSIAPGTPDTFLNLSQLTLADNSNLKFKFGNASNSDQINVSGNILAAGGVPVTVNVTFSGVMTGSTQVMSTSGTLDSKIHFALPTPVLDSADGINTSGASITTDYTFGTVTLNPSGAISDPAWSNASGGNWSTAVNWGPPNTVPNGGDKRGMFTASLISSVAITLDTSPRLSSMIFASPSSFESYTITPSDSTKAITLNSSIAQDWHITVLAGTHTVAANMKLAAGSGQSVIRLANGSHLTLGGVLSNETTAAGVNFEGMLNTDTGTGTGVLTLSGLNTYTGPTVIRSGVLEVASLSDAGVAGALGAATADSANLVFAGGMLKYVGGVPGSTNRGFTLLNSGGISTDQDLTISGKVTGTPQICDFTKSGTGGLTLSSTASDQVFKSLFVDQGTLTLQGTASVKPTFGINDNNYGDLQVGLNAHTATVNLSNVNLACKSGNVYIGNGTGSTGFANINEGTNITSENQFWWLVGVDGAQGVVNQTAGVVQVGVLTQIATGAQSWGVYNLSGGTVHHDYDLQVGVADGMGVVNQTGGIFNVGRLTTIANDGKSWGVYNMSGGTADINSHGWSFNVGNSGTGQGIVNLSGSAHLTANTTYLGVYDTSTGIVNLGAVGSGGGILSLPGIGKYSATATGYLNFHGGVLQATADNPVFLSESNQLSGVYVYKEGAKINTNGHAITIDSALLAPSGDGVKTISLTNTGSGYIGEPVVQITGGTGTGATARAVMSGDHIERIEITNPGTGYLSTDILTVNLVGGFSASGTQAVAGTVAFDANDTTGGLTKLGLGTLTLSGALSYAGDTFVNEGTLTITTPLNTPSADVSVATGGTLNAVSIVADSLNIGVAPLTPATGSTVPNAVPEPSTLVLLALAGLALAGAYFRRK